MKRLCKNKHWEINKNYNIDKILYLLIDRPTRINNSFIWKNNIGQDHRNYDLPAFIECGGYVAWYKNDFRHRNNNNPTTIYTDGLKKYYKN